MRRLSSWQRFVPVILLLAAASFVLEARNRIEVLPPHKGLAAFPMEIADSQGRDLKMDPRELEVLGAGDFLVRDYVSMSGEPPVNLYIAFFRSQRSGDTIHSPKNCLPGSGWSPTESGHILVRQGNDSTISINRYIIAKGADRLLVLYWYQAHGRVTASEYWAKILLVTDAIRLNRSDGALVRVITPILGPGDQGAAQDRAVRFVHQVLPMLDSYIPR